MKFLPRFVLFLLLAMPATAQVWQAVSSEELQMAAPRVEAGADAEVLFWEVRIVDEVLKSGWQNTVSQHLRIKIFTERGRERNSRVDIPFGYQFDTDATVQIKEIAARTIKPDGTVAEVKTSDIFDRDIIKADGAKFQAKSFALPGLEIGSIVEYRWKTIRNDVFNYSRIELARDLPIQFVKYYIRPPKNSPVGMRLHSFNTESGFKPELDGSYSTSMRNVPAFKEEPRMPSEYDVKPWVLMYYAGENERQGPASYWRDISREYYDSVKPEIKANGELKAAALRAIGDATEPIEKVRRIFDFCRKNVKNVYDDAAGLTPEQLSAIKENRTPVDTLKRGTGSWRDIDMLFAAMLVSVGFDARYGGAASRLDAVFNRNFTNAYFIRNRMIAVRFGNDWRFFTPGNPHLPFGMVSWAFQGQNVLVTDENEVIWQTVPTAAPEQSEQRRAAKLSLAPDGSLEGDVRYEMTGYIGEFYREFHDDDSPDERVKSIVARVRRAVGDTAEITNVVIENLDDAEKPLVYKFQIRIPNYAERTGKRVFLRPFVFGRNAVPLFSSASRTYDLSFSYSWKESDEISFELPKGFGVESAAMAKPVLNEKLGGSLTAKAEVSNDSKTLTYRREFSYGKPESLDLSRVFYSGIKGFFDSVGIADAQTIVLREDAAKAD